MTSVLQIGERITALPLIHGNGDFALEVRRMMLATDFDCLAVPLPPSFKPPVEQAILDLPTPTVVVQRAEPRFVTEWTPEKDDEDRPDESRASYVPIDPCQGVIAGLRVALGEHIPTAYIDLETAAYEPHAAALPDPYALKRVRPERFAAALLPAIPRVPAGQPRNRVLHMAARLRELERVYDRILLLCSVVDWPWIREAFVERTPENAEPDEVEPPEIYQPDPQTLLFLLGELPFITGLYERARVELTDDSNLSIDGVKELLLASREHYQAELKGRARKITPHTLRVGLKYIRNLTLLDRRLTPDFYTIVTAAQQTCGDSFALATAETAREYPFAATLPYERVALGIEKLRLPSGEILDLDNRLPGVPVTWRSCDLRRRPERQEQQRWQMSWNPYSQCSWPPEDEKIENFRTHVADRAKQLIGEDLVKTEKFTTSVKDGIDIRDTLRNWHTGDIYVREIPPARGHLDCVVMLFDAPADPRDYPWRTTWFAEHQNESTLAFFASNYLDEMVGPGIAAATYGGALFLFPPVAIPDIWRDRRLDFTETLEERLIAAGCLHANGRHIALLSGYPPGAGYRKLARRFGKRLVHVPLSGFSDATVQQLRIVHVLNGRQVRSFAAEFIRQG